MSRYLAVLLVASAAICRGQLITNLAGGGYQYHVNGLLGPSDGLINPQGVAKDAKGNVYYFDTGDFEVRQINAQDIVNTYAGNGTLGYYLIGSIGDGGAATGAGLGNAGIFAGLVFDSTGNLYISDPGNNRIRKVDTSGIITTFAGGSAIPGGDGGAATKAGLGQPAGVAVDSAGNVYVADFLAGTVRRINLGGIINTVAGGGSGGDGGQATSASIRGPKGLAIDKQGNIYIADNASRIRKVAISGVITTYAGGSNPGYGGDGGPAINALLSDPQGLAIDSAGNLYIADSGNHRVRKVDTSGNITTVVGDGKHSTGGDGGFATNAGIAPTGVAVDDSGNLYIADNVSNEIRKVALHTPPPGLYASTSSMYFEGTAKLPPPPQLIEFGTLGAQITFNVTAATSTGGTWLYANEPNAVTKSSVQVQVESPPTTPGTYQGTITATPVTPGYSPIMVQVTLVVTAMPPAQPVITDVENGASFQPGYLSNSIVTIKGTNLAPRTDSWTVVGGQLPTVLDGVTVTFGGYPAYISYISSTQINVVAPDTGLGALPAQVNNNGAMSANYGGEPTTVFSPAFFLWPGGQAVATHTDYSYAVAPGTFSTLSTVTAKPGEVIILWGTGFGPTTPPIQIGAVTPGDQEYSASTQPTVTVNGVNATVYGAALAAGYAGLYQVAIQVPPSLADGTYPVVATMGDIDPDVSPSGVMLAVHH